jgi:anti-sigma regulatory factor (Ser/Thr protein kinase)
MIKYKHDLKPTTRRMVPTRQRRIADSDLILVDHLLGTMENGFAFLDRQFRFQRVSQVLANMQGLSIDAFLGHTMGEVVGPAAWSGIEPHCFAALAGCPTSDVDITGALPRLSTSRRKVTASFRPVNGAGRIIGVGVIVKDVSESIQSECERASLMAQIHEAGAVRRGFLGEMLAALTAGKLRLCQADNQLPPTLKAVAPKVPLTREVLALFRHAVIDAASWLKFDQDRTGDIVLAVGEALDNVLVHAGDGTAQLFVDQRRGVIQVRVEDNGPGIDDRHLHRAALERGYTTAGSLGHGFYMILNTCDRIWLLTGESGTTLVLEQDKKPPLPTWLSSAA